MVSEHRCIGHGSPLKFSLDTGRLCSAGSGTTRYPTSSLVFALPTPTAPSASAPVTPCSRLPSADASSCGTFRFGHGLPAPATHAVLGDG